MPYCFNDDPITRTTFEFIEWEKVLLPFGGLLGGPAVEDSSILPRKARRTNNIKLCDCMKIKGVACVSQAFKDAVESVEPDTHQFFPIELQEKDGTPIEGAYFLFKNCQTAPCVLLKHSKVFPVRHVRDSGVPYRMCQPLGVGLSRPAVEGLHLWSSSAAAISPGSRLFMSDELYKMFRKYKLRPFRFHKAELYDEPWVAKDNVPELLKWMEENPDKAKNAQRSIERRSYLKEVSQ